MAQQRPFYLEIYIVVEQLQKLLQIIPLTFNRKYFLDLQTIKSVAETISRENNTKFTLRQFEHRNKTYLFLHQK